MKKNPKIFKKENLHYFKMMGVVFASILFFVLVSNLGVVWAVVRKILNVLLPLILGLSFAFVINMPLKFFENKLFGKLTKKNGKIWRKLKRPLCLILSLLLIFSVIVVLLSFVIPEFIRTCEKFFTKLPTAMSDISSTISGWLDTLHLPIADGDSFNINWNQISSWALTLIHQNQEQITSGALGFVTTVFTSVVNFILALVFCIYILASKESLGRLMKSFIYSIMKREPARKLISLVVLSNKAFSGFISGQCIEVLLIGILCFIGMLIFKMPYAIMVSCIIAFTAFIPVFGPFIGTAIGGFLILIENPIQALWFVLFIIILQQLESNIIYPKIMGKHVGLPGIWVLISVTIGGGLFGVVGIITSVPICSVLYTLFDKWIKRRLEERNICHRTMSHDSSEPKSIIEEMNLYEFEADYGDDFDDDEDDVYTDDGELRKIYDTDQNSTDAEKDDADINTPLDKQDAEDK
jgi:predicted PurR-regulated permease PerM